MKKKIQNSRKAFTLIEIMVAIAIVGIMAAVVLVSMNSYGAKARSSKALAQLSSAIPSMVSCWGNEGQVRKPNANGGNEICYINGALSTSYGYWPSTTSDMSSYKFTAGSLITTNCGGLNFCIDKSSDWWIYLSSAVGNDDKKICCNKKVGGCASSIKSESTNCDGTGWTD